MEVLFLTQVLPYPPDSGPKVKTWNVLKCLTRKHRITLVSFVRGDQSSAVARLRGICREVHTVQMVRGSVHDAMALCRSLLGGRPWVILRDDRAGMRRLVDQVGQSHAFDLVHSDQLNMAQYALRVRGPRRLLDAHNALWLLYERLAATTPNRAARWVIRRDAALLKQYEGAMCRKFHSVLTVTEVDRQALRQAAQSAGWGKTAADPRVVPIAVDTDEIQCRPRALSANHILHIGTMFWPPNVDGIRWFVDAVLPLVRRERPDVELIVVGANPPSDVLAWNTSRSGVHVAGYVEDSSPYFAGAGVFVVPLLSGGGMRVKILTAMAHRLPVVSTAVGCEGIDVVPGRDLLVADSPQAFAQATLRVLAEPRLAEELGCNGRRLVEQRYSLSRLADQLDDVYRAVFQDST